MRIPVRKNRSIYAENTNFPEVFISLECVAINGHRLGAVCSIEGGNMKLKTTALLITSLLVLAGCDQAEKVPSN
jgi:hypothetical protein